MVLRLVEPSSSTPAGVRADDLQQPALPCPFVAVVAAMGHAQSACAEFMLNPGPGSEARMERALWAVGHRVGIAQSDLRVERMVREARGEAWRAGEGWSA